jgi:hypothetical protein
MLEYLKKYNLTPEQLYSTGCFAALNYCDSKFQLEQIKQDGTLIKYIKNPSKELQLEAMKEFLSAFQYIENPSEEIQLIAVKRNGYMIRDIKNPSEELQLAAIKNNYWSIECIENPTEKIQLAALKICGEAIKHIKNPTKKVIKIINEIFSSDETIFNCFPLELFSCDDKLLKLKIDNYFRKMSLKVFK